MTSQALDFVISAARSGDRPAIDHVFELLYDELRGLARRQRRRWRGEATLGTTALVHEVDLKLANAGGIGLEGESHFLGVAARAMRQLLSNHARDRHRLKRGGDRQQTSVDVEHLAADIAGRDLDTVITIDDALSVLEHEHPRMVRVVECRFFAGLSVPDTARALGTSAATVKRDWSSAQRWLYARLGDGGGA
jgi:RNA polymerase sigma factor (TIGR02999 family)